MSYSDNKNRYSTLASELAGRGRKLRIKTVLFNVGGDTVRSKKIADRLGAAFVDVTAKLWHRKCDHYLATHPSTTELHKQFLNTQKQYENKASIVEDISSLPVSRNSATPSIPSRRGILSLDIVPPAATPVRVRTHY